MPAMFPADDDFDDEEDEWDEANNELLYLKVGLLAENVAGS